MIVRAWNPIVNETAIVVRSDKAITGAKYFILIGDHREAYSKIIDLGLAECFDYFVTNSHLQSDWSNSLEEAKNDRDNSTKQN